MLVETDVASSTTPVDVSVRRDLLPAEQQLRLARESAVAALKQRRVHRSSSCDSSTPSVGSLYTPADASLTRHGINDPAVIHTGPLSSRPDSAVVQIATVHRHQQASQDADVQPPVKLHKYLSSLPDTFNFPGPSRLTDEEFLFDQQLDDFTLQATQGSDGHAGFITWQRSSAADAGIQEPRTAEALQSGPVQLQRSSTPAAAVQARRVAFNRPASADARHSQGMQQRAGASGMASASSSTAQQPGKQSISLRRQQAGAIAAPRVAAALPPGSSTAASTPSLAPSAAGSRQSPSRRPRDSAPPARPAGPAASSGGRSSGAHSSRQPTAARLTGPQVSVQRHIPSSSDGQPLRASPPAKSAASTSALPNSGGSPTAGALATARSSSAAGGSPTARGSPTAGGSPSRSPGPAIKQHQQAAACSSPPGQQAAQQQAKQASFMHVRLDTHHHPHHQQWQQQQDVSPRPPLPNTQARSPTSQRETSTAAGRAPGYIATTAASKPPQHSSTSHSAGKHSATARQRPQPAARAPRAGPSSAAAGTDVAAGVFWQAGLTAEASTAAMAGSQPRHGLSRGSSNMSTMMAATAASMAATISFLHTQASDVPRQLAAAAAARDEVLQHVRQPASSAALGVQQAGERSRGAVQRLAAGAAAPREAAALQSYREQLAAVAVRQWKWYARGRLYMCAAAR